MYLHKGDYVSTTTFHDSECIKEWVYVDGLSNGQYIANESPYLLQKDNGVIVSLDQSFSTIHVLHNDGTLIKTIDLNFITECLSTEKEQSLFSEDSLPMQENSPSYFNIVLPLFAVLLVGCVFVRYIKKH